MLLATITFAAKHWTWPAIALVVLGFTLAVWSYWRSHGPRLLRTMAALLKLVAFGLLAICLVEPVQQRLSPVPGANNLVILLDNSRSMAIHSFPGSKGLATQFQQHLQPEATWLDCLNQDYAVKQYLFDSRLHSSSDLSKAEFTGAHSMLDDALSTLHQRFSSGPMAGLLLFTDGLATDSVALDELPKRGWPIFPVVSSGKLQLCDVAVTDCSARLSSFELSPISLEATVQIHGLAGQEITVRVLDQSGRVLDQKQHLAVGDEDEQKIRFQVRLPDPGWQTVTVQALLSQEDVGAQTVVQTIEATQANNRRTVSVDQGGGPYRILYVSGRPNWEFKFLRRALDADPQLRLQALLRIAKQEPRFSFGDRTVGQLNPLVAGFSDNPDTAQQYDEPVLLRIGADSDSQLQAGFPSSAEELYRYDALLLDDVESQFFTAQQMMLIRAFVAERGGGLMMLGGQESFLDGQYEGTPLGDLLPVYLRGSDQPARQDSSARYSLTREGELQTWLRLRATKPDEQDRFAHLPEFLVWNSIAEIKPGAVTLATLQTEQQTLPGFVTQKFGKGQSAALLLGDFWRWSMRRVATDEDDLEQVWRQIARWLTSDVPRRVELEVQSPESSAGPHRLSVLLRDQEFKPLDNATVQADVTQPDGNCIQISLQPDQERPGCYRADYWSRLDGGYACTIQGTSPDGSPLDILQSGWGAEPSATEMSRVMPDLLLLKSIAEKSGGQIVPLDQLDAFCRNWPLQSVPLTETRIESWWHRPWLVTLAVVCLCSEWALRRWKGLP